MMRKECLGHAELPCKPLDNEMFGEQWYEVKNTGAIVTLSSSVQLLHFYCSRLPSDRFVLQTFSFLNIVLKHQVSAQ